MAAPICKQLFGRLCFLLIVWIRLMSNSATATLTTSFVGRPCPEELITFTCTVSGIDLVWDPSDAASISLNTLTPLNTPLTEGLYTVILISSNSGLVSTLSTTARDGITVRCQEPPNPLTESVMIILVDPPSPPQNVGHTLLISTADVAIVSVEWEPPVDNGGRDELNYTVNISPSTQLSSTVVTSTTVTVTADYNVNHTLSIMATNCAGDSTTVEYRLNVGTCPLPMNPVNGNLGPVTSRAEGSTVTFQCNDGFTPTGEMTATCMADMTWNPDPGSVVCSPTFTSPPPVDCGVPDPPVNGSFGGSIEDTSLGSVIFYKCNDSLFPIGNLPSTCGSNGMWNPNPMDQRCTTEQCTSTILDAGGVVGITIATVITFTVSVLIGLAIGMLLMYFIMRAKINKLMVTERQPSPPGPPQQQTTPQQQQTTPAGPVYEEVSQPREEIELKTNQSYGPVRH